MTRRHEQEAASGVPDGGDARTVGGFRDEVGGRRCGRCRGDAPPGRLRGPAQPPRRRLRRLPGRRLRGLPGRWYGGDEYDSYDDWRHRDGHAYGCDGGACPYHYSDRRDGCDWDECRDPDQRDGGRRDRSRRQYVHVFVPRSRYGDDDRGSAQTTTAPATRTAEWGRPTVTTRSDTRSSSGATTTEVRGRGRSPTPARCGRAGVPALRRPGQGRSRAAPGPRSRCRPGPRSRGPVGIAGARPGPDRPTRPWRSRPGPALRPRPGLLRLTGEPASTTKPSRPITAYFIRAAAPVSRPAGRSASGLWTGVAGVSA